MTDEIAATGFRCDVLMFGGDCIVFAGGFVISEEGFDVILSSCDISFNIYRVSGMVRR